MFYILLDFIAAITAFLPGILLLFALPKKKSLQLTFLEKILFGSVLWNYILISISLLLGLFSKFATDYFGLFGVFSFAVVIISLGWIIKHAKVSFHLRLTKEILMKALYALCFMSVLLICFLLVYFHSMFLEWDAISYYIPSAKAILSSHGVSSQPYYLLNFFDVSPSIPIVYAWLIGFSDLSSAYDLTVFYFALTTVAIFLISRRILSRQMAFVSTIVFASLPAVVVTLSSRSFYLDLPFVLFSLSTLYAAIRIAGTEKETGEKNFVDYILFGASLALMCLTRVEFGLILIPSILVTTLMAFKVKWWQVISALTLGLALYAREGRNILLDPFSWPYYIQRLIPVFAVSVLFFLFSVSLYRNSIKGSLSKKSFVFAVFPLLPLLLYLLKNIFAYGFIIPELPTSNEWIFAAVKSFSKISSSSSPVMTGPHVWDGLLGLLWLVLPYLIPITVAVFSSVYRLTRKGVANTHEAILVLFFIGFFVLWSTLYFDPQPRRLYYFAPFVGLIAAYGLLSIKKFYSALGFALRVPTYITSLTSLTLMKIGAKTVNDVALFYAQLYEPKIDFTFVAIAFFLFGLIFIPYEFLFRGFAKKVNLSRKLFGTSIISMMALNVVIIALPASPIFSAAMNYGYQYRQEYFGGFLYYPDVVDYYNQNINDSGVTIGFYCHELITFANRSIIDLSDPVYGAQIYSILDSANETILLKRLKDLNVLYLLKPEQANPFYPDFEKLANNTALGAIFLDNPRICPLKAFKYATLFRFYQNCTVQPLTYSEAIPWNYESTRNHTITVNQNNFSLSGTTDSSGRLSLMLTVDHTANTGKMIWLHVRTYTNATIYATFFSNLADRTGGFLTFKSSANNETKKPLINLDTYPSCDDFSSAHIEGVLIGIQTRPNSEEVFDVQGAYSIIYEYETTDYSFEDSAGSYTYVINSDGAGDFWATANNGTHYWAGLNSKATIQNALDNVAIIGGSVFVKSGSYNASVMLKDNSRLIIAKGVIGLTVRVNLGATCVIEDYRIGITEYYVSGALTTLIDQVTGKVQTILTYANLVSDFSFVVWTDGTNYYAAKNGTSGQIVYSGTNASAAIQAAVNALGMNGGRIMIKKGDYGISSTISLHGGINIQGEGMCKYTAEQGTRLRLTANVSLFTVNAQANNNQYFVQISNMELYGDGRAQTTGAVGIHLKSGFSDYLIEEVFIHGFSEGIIVSQDGWYGRIIKCWIEANAIGLDVKHQQVMVESTNLSGNGVAIKLSGKATEIILSNLHVFSNSIDGLLLDFRTNGTYNIIVGNSQFVDVLNGIEIYAYTNVTVNISFNNCEFGQYVSTAQKYAFNVWTAGTGKINLQCGLSKFFPVASTYINHCTGSTRNVSFVFDKNTGYVTENSGTTQIANGGYFAHGLANKPTTIILNYANGTYEGVPVIANPILDGTNTTHVQVSLCWSNGTAITTPLIISYYCRFDPQ